MTPDLEAIFAPPSRPELAAVEIDWSIRNPLGVDLKVEAARELPDRKRLLVVSHFVDWRRHYAALRLPAGTGPHPLLLLNHNGTDGVDITEINEVDAFLNDATLSDNCIVLLPSYRSESLRAGELGTYQSTCESGEMDRDADDAIALLDAVIRGFPEADAGRAAALGFSRGGHVALHSAMREPRLHGVVDFFCATNFFHPEVKSRVAAALAGKRVRNPIIVSVLRDVVTPLASGDYTLEQARAHLIRISPGYFAARLPRLQLHHGAKDPLINTDHSEFIVETLRQAGRTDFEYHTYPEGVHDRNSLPGAGLRAAVFLRGVLDL